MKKLSQPTLLALGMLVLLASACKEEPDPVIPDPSKFQLEFVFQWDGVALERDVFYPAPDGRSYAIQNLKFYVSHVALTKSDQSKVEVDDVALVDIYYPNTQIVSAEVATGTYNGLSFSLGLDTAQNHTDPSHYAVEHPLSSVANMYWNWYTNYIFAKVEGIADTTGADSLDISFLYHPGLDSIRQDLSFSGLEIQVGEGETKKHTVALDLKEVFFGATDTIDVRRDPATHTMDNPGLALRVMRNLKAAMH